MLNLASIDIGSNTLRLLIGRIKDNTIIRERCEMKITRLASNISSTGILQDENIEKSLSVLKAFSLLISSYNVPHVKAVGTSALREAENSDEFRKRALSETGIQIEIVSGKEEAELTAKGVLFDIHENISSFILDIGGGSTEWILCKGNSAIKTGTVSIGVVKLLEKHLRSDPPSINNINLLKKELNDIAESIHSEIKNDIDDKTVFIGTAGTITTLAAIDLGLKKYDREKVHMHRISLRRMNEISDHLLSIPLSRRKKITGLEPERADLIIPGIVFTINIIQNFGFSEIIVSDNGLLEGALIKLSEEVYR
ncbi:MAG: Ppx/GppA family phosphatase [Nitrospiraceae bacterium]|nr:Ppx/GppA family phosphatase [Nitrospiraceae bacterium]